MDMEVSMSMSNTNGDTKVVQTELSSADYARFRRLAQDEGKSLKEALHEAAAEYIDAHDAPNPNDPLFTIADEMTALNEDRHGEPLAPDELDDALYKRPHEDDRE